MKLDDFRASDNVDDRRGGGSGGGGGGGFPIGRGGLGIGGVVVVLIISYFTGMSPQALMGVAESVLGGGGGSVVTTDQPSRNPTGAPSDQDGQFVAKILGSTEDTWTQVFKEQVGKPYTKPRLVMFSGVTNSGCGTAQSAMGPFYCPNDQQVYLDTEFFDEMKTRPLGWVYLSSRVVTVFVISGPRAFAGMTSSRWPIPKLVRR